MPTKILTALQTDLANADTTESKLRAYHQLVDFLVTKNPLLAEQYMDEGLNLAITHDLLIHIVFFMYCQISFYSVYNNHKKSFEIMIRISPLLKKVENQAIGYMILSDILYVLYRNRTKADLSNYILSIRIKSLEVIDEEAVNFYKNITGKNLKILFLRQIAFTLIQLEHYEEAKRYLEVATCLLGLNVNKKDLFFTCFYWVEYYFRIKDARLCIDFSHKALAFFYEADREEAHMDGINVQLYAMMGVAYMEYLGEYENATKYFEKAIEICTNFNLPLPLANLYMHAAHLYKRLKNWQLAYEYAEKANQVFLQDIKSRANQNASLAQEILEDCYIQMGFLEDFIKQKMQKPQQLAAENEHLQYAQYIQTHCVNPRLTVQDIAQHFNMSAKSLNRQIQKFFGLSVQKFIIFLRLQKAHQLLSDTQKSVTEVAEMVGFEHIPYFGICFKKQYGILPSKLKQSKK